MSDYDLSNLCVNCEFLLGNRNYLERYKEWRCGAKENTGIPILNLVSGELELNLINPLCIEQRREQLADNRCGPNGKWYKKYNKPAFLENVDTSQLTGKKKTRVSEEDLNNL